MRAEDPWSHSTVDQSSADWIAFATAHPVSAEAGKKRDGR
jgi:hypothetical protein